VAHIRQLSETDREITYEDFGGEFSSGRRSVAVVEDGRVLSEAFDVGGALPLIWSNARCPQAQVDREQIECIAVGIGAGFLHRHSRRNFVGAGLATCA